ncbi:MAG: chemotaxis protein CheB [Campylobacterales bacterium]|nr:chemotaxis protein CheB [Campylobacterales bacterium]
MYFVPKRVVLIGASTGGPNQIERIVESLAFLQSTSIIIAQHMVDGFIDSYAKRVQEKTKNSVSVAKDGDRFESSHIYICKGFTTFSKDNYRFECKAPTLNSYNPDINTVFASFIPSIKDMKTLCVILTGIGDDGVASALELSKNGARCITEDKQSAIVDGMPFRARTLIPDIEVYSLEKIIEVISEFCDDI